MKPRKKKTPSYDLCDVKYLVLMGRRVGTTKGLSWLLNHGFEADLAWEIVLSLEEAEFVESLSPKLEGGPWADVYRSVFQNEQLRETFYVKFIVEGQTLSLTLLSCKEWGFSS